MRAIVLTKTGGIENLVQKEVEKPTPQSGEVLIQAKSISINPVDAFVRKNQQYFEKILKLGKDATDAILGWDVAGVVVATGNGVKNFKIGDEVFGMIQFPGSGRAYAEYVLAPADQIAIKPSNISFDEAAAATLTALTAWQALVDDARLTKGEKILIHAAAGGVGHYAVQIAKQLGAYVIASGSAKSKSIALDMGADEFINYEQEKFQDLVTDADVVLDSFDDLHLRDSLKSLKSGGRLVSLLEYGSDELKSAAQSRNVAFFRVHVKSNGEDMNQIAEWLKAGKLKSVISRTYPFDQIGEAHLQVETGKTHGKIIVHV